MMFNDFFLLVAKLREAQRAYKARGSRSNLQAARELEMLVDHIIAHTSLEFETINGSFNGELLQ